MREILIPARVQVNNIDYEILLQMLNDDVITARGNVSYSVNFEERSEGQVLIPAARNWVNNKIGFDPFIIPSKNYYIGSDTPNSMLKKILEGFNVEYYKIGETGDQQPTTLYFNNGDHFPTRNDSNSTLSANSAHFFSYAEFNTFTASCNNWVELTPWTASINFKYFPTNAIRGDKIEDSTGTFASLVITFDGVIASLNPYVKRISIQVITFDGDLWQQTTSYGDLINLTYAELNADINGFSNNNPYEINPSTWGGGYGTGIINPSDLIPDPEAPEIDAITTGLLTVFKPTLAQIQSLGDYLWSNAFDVDTLKKLFADPMQAIIGLAIVPINPPAAGSKSVKIGDVDTGISMPYVSRQFVEKDLGSISIDPFIGSFMDYAPYTKIDIYLPYIGFRTLDPADVMGTTLNIKYIIDVITGGCNAVINVSGKGAIYQFNGSCIANVPLSAINYSGAIQNAVSAVGSGITTVAGIASGNIPVGIMGVAGLASNAANTAVNSKPTIQRSGAMGGAAGLCSVQFPYVVIERPRLSTPAGYNSFVGNTLNVTMQLSDCHGLTIVDNIHLDNVICTDDERNELMSLLHQGVIL